MAGAGGRARRRHRCAQPAALALPHPVGAGNTLIMAITRAARPPLRSLLMPLPLRALMLVPLLGAAAAAAEAPAAAGEPDRSQGTVVLPLTGSCAVRTAQGMFGDGAPSQYEVTTQLRSVLQQAAERNVVLDCSEDFHPGLATAEELAAVIRSAKGAKHVSILINQADDRTLVVAAACDEVVMPEAGLLTVGGLSLASYYFADALAKLGITFHAVISGEHKTAPEALTRSAPSPAGAQELHDLVADLDKILVADAVRGGLDAGGIAAARALSPQPAAVAVAQKLVDKAVEPDGWLADLPAPVRTIKDKAHEAPDLSSLTGIMQFMSQLTAGDRQEKKPKVVAVVELAGTIVDGRSSEPGVNIAPGDTDAMLDQLRDDPRVVGVVLRVDSPGGSAEASDHIHHALKRLVAAKPVVALFDAVAASGGYYLACAVPEILVHHGTITGSIGVFAVAPDASATLGLLGINRVLVESGPRADIFGMGAWSDDKEAALKAIVVDTDHRFQALVAANRHLDPKVVETLAGGRVYTGEQAVALKLADGYGTLLTAVQRVRALAHEPDPLPLERYPRAGGLLARLGLANSSLGPVPAQLRLWTALAASSRPSVLAWRNLDW
jgi:protease-4